MGFFKVRTGFSFSLHVSRKSRRNNVVNMKLGCRYFLLTKAHLLLCCYFYYPTKSPFSIYIFRSGQHSYISLKSSSPFFYKSQTTLVTKTDSNILLLQQLPSSSIASLRHINQASRTEREEKTREEMQVQGLGKDTVVEVPLGQAPLKGHGTTKQVCGSMW